MSEYIDRGKIKTCFAQIIVNNSDNKPYYSIMYWENGEMNIGFSSYKLDYVRRWLNEEFEVKRNVDVVPVVHGEWVRPHWRNSNFCYDCSVCGNEVMHQEYRWRDKKIYPICPWCGAKMRENNEI